MKYSSISVIIRAYNEAGPLARLLDNLKQQDYPSNKIEIIVVDNGSRDNTAEIAKQAGAKVIHLDQADFNYPKSSNLGIRAATGEIIVLVSAHCLPVRIDWLSTANHYLSIPLATNKIAGIHAHTLPMPDSPLIEKVVRFTRNFILSNRPAHPSPMKVGTLGATNCAIRRELWEQHPFDEVYGSGGEDMEWARWAVGQGYLIWFDPRFAVHHSHYLDLKGLLAQQKYYLSLGSTPRPFKREGLGFRKDIKD